MATPMKSAKLVNDTPSGASDPYRPSAKAAPNTNGSVMLACEIVTVA